MFLLRTVTRPIKIMAQTVPSPALMTTNSSVLRQLCAESREPGARMSPQSAVMVCINSLISIFRQAYHVVSSVIDLRPRLAIEGISIEGKRTTTLEIKLTRYRSSTSKHIAR